MPLLLSAPAGGKAAADCKRKSEPSSEATGRRPYKARRAEARSAAPTPPLGIARYAHSVACYPPAR
eukprot:300713-Rhodomonas_salina.2